MRSQNEKSNSSAPVLTVGVLVDRGECKKCNERGFLDANKEHRCPKCRGSGRILMFESEIDP